MEQLRTTDIQQSVMQRIHAGTTRAKPAWHFVLRTALVVLGALLVLLTLFMLLSFIGFSLRQSGMLAAPHMGLYGIGIFARELPWLLIGVGALFLIVLEMLARQFAFAYRRPLLVSLAIITAFALVGGVVLSRAPMHRQFFERAAQDRLPVVGPMYRRYGMGGDGRIHPGIIASVQGDILTISTRRGDMVQVHITATTKLPDTPLSRGDAIIVLGEREGASISAMGIQRMETPLPLRLR